MTAVHPRPRLLGGRTLLHDQCVLFLLLRRMARVLESGEGTGLCSAQAGELLSDGRPPSMSPVVEALPGRTWWGRDAAYCQLLTGPSSLSSLETKVGHGLFEVSGIAVLAYVYCLWLLEPIIPDSLWAHLGCIWR